MRRRSTFRADLGELRDARLSLAMSAAPRGKAEPTRARAERTHKCPKCERVLRDEMGLRHHFIQFHEMNGDVERRP